VFTSPPRQTVAFSVATWSGQSYGRLANRITTYVTKMPKPTKRTASTRTQIVYFCFFHHRFQREMCTLCPQRVQCLRVRSLTVPHQAHRVYKSCPHRRQKPLRAGFSLPHFAHSIAAPFEDWLLLLYCCIISLVGDCNTLLRRSASSFEAGVNDALGFAVCPSPNRN